MSHDEFTTRALEEGRLDEAIRHLAAPERSAEDRRMLATLLTYRGRFVEAELLLRREFEAGASTNSLGADDWRALGNAAWRADHLSDALRDLHAALRVESDLAKAQRIQGDVGVLEAQVASLRNVARQLGRVDAATLGVAGLLVLATVWATVAASRRRRHETGTGSP